MNPIRKETLACLRMLPRALAVILAVSAPLLAVPSLLAADSAVIEAPKARKTGAGFVLMISLQRA